MGSPVLAVVPTPTLRRQRVPPVPTLGQMCLSKESHVGLRPIHRFVGVCPESPETITLVIMVDFSFGVYSRSPSPTKRCPQGSGYRCR